MTRASSDSGILSQLIGLHYYHEPITLDATWGRGAIWRGCPYQPTTRFDARPMRVPPAVAGLGVGLDQTANFASLKAVYEAFTERVLVPTWRMLWDREEGQVRVGWINDQFIRNIQTLLAELRAAFGVLRGAAFSKVTGL